MHAFMRGDTVFSAVLQYLGCSTIIRYAYINIMIYQHAKKISSQSET